MASPLVGVALWWVLLFAGYLMLVSPLSGGEFVLGAVLSGLAAGTAMTAHRMSGSPFTLPPGGVGGLLRIPAAVLADTWWLARLVGSQLRRRAVPVGALRRLTLAAAPDELREQQAQAVAGLMLSLSPGSFVVDSSPSPPRLLIHAVRDELGVVEKRVVERSVQR